MVGIQTLLDRLDGVQRSGNGWRAKCPACGGRSRKLAVTEAETGRVLVHCFAGCVAADVVHALGLDLADLFPDRLPPEEPEARRAWIRASKVAQWGAALDVLTTEATIVQVASRDLAAGRALTPEDASRLALACDRITDAKGVLRA